jgi:hypothetical protein
MFFAFVYNNISIQQRVFMSWVKSASNSLLGAISGFSGLGGLMPAPSEQALQNRAEEIRTHMLSTLGEQGARAYPSVRRKVMFATDLEGLWYVRSEWMTAISAVHGERVAAAHLRSVNIMFEGLGNRGMSSRPSPLN